MKRVIRITIVLLILAGLSAVGVSYFFGSMRVKREAKAYTEALERCAPFDQKAWAPLLKGSLGRAVIGTEDGSCVVTMEAMGAGQVRCALDDNGKALMLQYIREGVETVTFLGGQTASLSYSSENPDAMTQLLNGPDCKLTQ